MQPILLPVAMTPYDVANACREAIDAFLALDDKEPRALSRWFSGPYRRATSFAPRRRGLCGPARRAIPVSVLIAEAQDALRAAIAAAHGRDGERLIAMLPAIIAVAPVRDDDGARGFAPMDQTSAPLLTRLLTLLIADYLTRPDTYLADRRCDARSTTQPEIPALRAGRAGVPGEPRAGA